MTSKDRLANVVVDLSQYRKNADFKLAKEDGIEGVIHKATEGLTYVDPTYEERRQAAEREGLLFGAYHFGIWGNGRDQAEHFLKTVGNTSRLLLVLWLDEFYGGDNMRPTQAEDFVNKVHEATGRFPMVYGVQYFLEYFNTPTLKKCPLWIADYTCYTQEPTLPSGWETWILWQYTDGSLGHLPQSVKGIGSCGRSRVNGTSQDSSQALKDFWTPKSKTEMITNVVVDLSHWDAKVDFKLAKEDGIEGIIYKATQGLTYFDPTYAERRNAAEKEGLLFGAYHFGTGDSGEEQAVHFLKKVGNTSKVLLVLDIEQNNSGTNMRPKQAEDFVNKVHEATGRFPMIYGSAYFLQDFDTPILKKCPLWIARYGANPILPRGWEKWTLWQYTDGQSGEEPQSVKGIGSCDRNKFNGTLQELKNFWTSG